MQKTKLRKKLQNNEKTREYLNSLPRIYLVATWAKTGVREFPFTQQYEWDKYAQSKVPLVYQYDDLNGTEDSYYLRKITQTTGGLLLYWTEDPNEAISIANEENARRHD